MYWRFEKSYFFSINFLLGYICHTEGFIVTIPNRLTLYIGELTPRKFTLKRNSPNVYKISVWDYGKVPQMDNGNGCTMMIVLTVTKLYT
jgi:hypothetical protein